MVRIGNYFHSINGKLETVMLGLRLRDEFLGKQMAGTAIQLRGSDGKGATEKPAEQILDITYPTADVQMALGALGKDTGGLPVVLVGDRGRGKSHIMAVMHHAIASPEIVQKWMRDWGQKTGAPILQKTDLKTGYFPITEQVHNNEYTFLWDLLFDRHPNGQYYRGKFETMSQSVPPRSLLESMFAEQPICLILDELQTWFDGLGEKDKNGVKVRQNAFNFIQVLSEIAKDMPDKFILVISTLNSNNEAYQQVHRVGETLVSFHGATARQDRQNLLLHRLFVNRSNIPHAEIAKIAATYADERSRLLFSDKSVPEQQAGREEVFQTWPFSPELLALVDDQTMVASEAQNTRDLIRVLAQLYKDNGESVPMLTPADFYVDGQKDGAQKLISNMGQAYNLIEIAQRNLESVRNSGANVAHDREMISAIWMYSLAMGLNPGVSDALLHLVITRYKPIDDNTFQVELERLIENSINIHGDERPNRLLRFKSEENPRSKVKSYAKNSKIWDPGAAQDSVSVSYPGKDIEHIRKTIKAIFTPDGHANEARVIVLGQEWNTNPWADVEENDRPDKWNTPVLLVVPDKMPGDSKEINKVLGEWLKTHVSKRRNTVRFLLVDQNMKSLFNDKDLIFQARCSYLCSKNAWGNDRVYLALSSEFDRALRHDLESRFTRFAILRKWNYQNPENCIFEIEKLNAQGAKIPAAVEQKIKNDLFDPTEFENFVLKFAQKADTVGNLLDALTEPPAPGTGEAIPFLAENELYEKILKFAASGHTALNVAGTWIMRRPEDRTDADALSYIRSKAFHSPQENRQVQLNLPGVVGSSSVSGQSTAGTDNEKDGGKDDEQRHTDTTPAGQQTDVPDSSAGSNGEQVGGVNQPDSPPYGSRQPVRREKSVDSPVTGINLSGTFEKWGLDQSQELDEANIIFAGLTVQQMRQILTKIPSSFKAAMKIAYTEQNEE